VISPKLQFRVWRYCLRSGSGGAGLYPGGEGLLRELELLTPTSVTLLTERRVLAPYGLNGGKPGGLGINTLIQQGQETPLPGKVQLQLMPGPLCQASCRVS